MKRHLRLKNNPFWRYFIHMSIQNLFKKNVPQLVYHVDCIRTKYQRQKVFDLLKRGETWRSLVVFINIVFIFFCVNGESFVKKKSNKINFLERFRQLKDNYFVVKVIFSIRTVWLKSGNRTYIIQFYKNNPQFGYYLSR